MGACRVFVAGGATVIFSYDFYYWLGYSLGVLLLIGMGALCIYAFLWFAYKREPVGMLREWWRRG